MSRHPGAELDAYLDGHLPDADMRRVRAHLAACPHCRRELERAQRLRERLSSALGEMVPRVPMPVPAPVRAPVWRRYAWAGAAVGAVALLVFAYSVSTPHVFLARSSQIDGTRVAQAGGDVVTLTATGDVYVGDSKLEPALADRVRRTFERRAWPHIKEAESDRTPNTVVLRHPPPADDAAISPPQELAWSGPAGAPYTVYFEAVRNGAWAPVAGFPRSVFGYSVRVEGLEPGVLYRWRVDRPDGVGSGWERFRVLSSDETRLVRTARERYGDKSVVFGSVCASVGLYREAESIFSYQAARQPDDPNLTEVLTALRTRMGEPGR